MIWKVWQFQVLGQKRRGFPTFNRPTQFLLDLFLRSDDKSFLQISRRVEWLELSWFWCWTLEWQLDQRKEVTEAAGKVEVYTKQQQNWNSHSAVSKCHHSAVLQHVRHSRAVEDLSLLCFFPISNQSSRSFHIFSCAHWNLLDHIIIIGSYYRQHPFPKKSFTLWTVPQ